MKTLSRALLCFLALAPVSCSDDDPKDPGTTNTPMTTSTTNNMASDMGQTTTTTTTTVVTPTTTKETTTVPLDMGVTSGGDMKTTVPDAGTTCTDTPLYEDKDGDGKGSGAVAKTVCLAPSQGAEAGFSVDADDCNDDDALQYPGASGVCGDKVDDDCDQKDETCPASMPAQMNVPSWDCKTGAPPQNVYAWALVEDVGPNLITPGCMVIFAGAKDRFFVQRVGLGDTPSCTNPGSQIGCICRSQSGSGYDQRLYAFTRDPDAASCPDIALGSGSEGKVSNACRKFLYPMGNKDLKYSFVSTNVAELDRRLKDFGKVEIACVREVTQPGFIYKTLLETDIQRNDAFKMPAK